MGVRQRESDQTDESLIETQEATDSDLPLEPLAAGTILGGRYAIEALIGEGGAGQVFRVQDLVMGERLALKVLRPERAGDSSWIRRLAREVKIARGIRHPHVCRVFELGHADGRWFISMELAEGGTLRDLLRGGFRAAEPPLGASADPLWSGRLAGAKAVCAGLAAIHAAGIVHRDVTPQNVLLMNDGRLILSDLGLAIEAGDSTTFVGGTPRYMAPEVVAGGRAGMRADVWQLGLVLHEILFGRRPEWRDAAGKQSLTSPVGDGATPVEEALASLCADCLQQDPQARPASAIEVAARLSNAERSGSRAWLARAWRGGARVARSRNVRVVRFLALGLALSAGVGAAWRAGHDRATFCGSPAQRLAGVWEQAEIADSPRKQAIQRAFLATGAPYGGEIFQTVRQVLDRYADAWLAMSREACDAARPGGDQSPEVLELRVSCLSERLGRLKTLTDVFVQPTPTTVKNAGVAAGSLPALDRCADVKLLRSIVPLPDDPAIRARIEALRGDLTVVRALDAAGQCGDAIIAGRKLIADAKAIGYPPLELESLNTLARSGSACMANEEYLGMCRQGVLVASAAHDPEAAVEYMTEMAFGLADRVGDLGQAQNWADLAEATLRGMSRPRPFLEAWRLLAVSRILSKKKQFNEALDAANRGLDLNIAVQGPDHPDVMRSLIQIGLVLEEMDRPEDALKYWRRAEALSTAAHSFEPPFTAMVLTDEAEALNMLHRFADAHSYAQRALQIGRRVGSNGLYLAWALTTSGEALLGDGRPHDAEVDLEEAIKLCGDGEILVLPRARFALARALWHKPQQRRRAIQLAQLARKGPQADPDPLFASPTEIDAWLRAHRP